MTLRDVVKTVGETALVRSGLAHVSRRKLRGRAVVLAYHNVVPAGEAPVGETSLHLPQRAFARQLDLIASAYDVVPLSALLDDVAVSARPRVAITFDDAYLGAISAGLEELRLRSMPATVFVAPGLLGGDTWWDRLAGATAGVMPDDVRRHAIETLRGDRDNVLAWFAAQGGEHRHSLSGPRIATESELAVASRQSGITFGSHTWSHRNLSRLTSDELERELISPITWLQQRFANAVEWLSYPYGLSSPGVEHMADRAKYRGAFLVSGGWMSKHPNRVHALPRLSIPAGLSANGLLLRLSGIASNR